MNLREARDEAERREVARALARANGNLSKAAELLGVSRPTLYDLLNRFGLRKQDVTAGRKISMRLFFACCRWLWRVLVAGGRIDVAVAGMSQGELRRSDCVGSNVRGQRRAQGGNHSVEKCVAAETHRRRSQVAAGARVCCMQAIRRARRRELRKALEYGQPIGRRVAAAGALDARTGRSDKLIAEFGDRKLTEPDAEAAFRATLGQAQLQLGKLSDAAASFKTRCRAETGISRPPSSAWRGCMVADNKIDDASRLIDAVIAANPKAAEAYAMQSDLRLFRGDRAGAKTSLEQAVAADGSFMPARYALIQLLINEKQFDAAAVATRCRAAIAHR